MKWLFSFKKKKSSPKVEDVRQLGSRLIQVQSLDILGPFSKSRNGEYFLVRQDSDTQEGIGGYRDSGNGRFALINHGKVIFSGECERPTQGNVADTGIFAIGDTLFGDKLGSKLYVYDADGTLLLSHSFSAAILNIGISTNGSHVAVQLCNSDTDDSGRLYLFDVSESKVVSAFAPSPGWANKYEFSVADKVVYLCYENDRRYRYSFDGEFIDKQRYDYERIEDASPTDLVFIVQEKLKSAAHKELPSLLEMINRALASDLSELQDYLALGYRVKGEIQEGLGDFAQAIDSYHSALNIDPKVGVKRKLNRLKKSIEIENLPSKKQKIKPPKTHSESNRISCSEVQEVVYNFTQYAFIGGEIKDHPLDPQRFPEVLAILQAGTLSQQEVSAQSLQVQRVIYELLTQYIMFLTMNPELPFPQNFLDESSPQKLGAMVTAYMAENGWPFPQMLAK